MVAFLVFTHWEVFWKQQLADSLSLEIYSYLGLGSRLSNARHGKCSGSVSSLIALPMKDVSRPLWCHLRMWSSGHCGCQEDLGGGGVQLLLSYPAISASTSLAWPPVKKRTCSPFVLCLWFLGDRRKDVHGSSLTFPQLTVDGIHRGFCWAPV